MREGYWKFGADEEVMRRPGAIKPPYILHGPLIARVVGDRKLSYSP